MRVRGLSYLSSLLLFLIVCAPDIVRAQGSIVISGVVTDVSGAVVPDAAVDALVAGRRTSGAITGSDGSYRLDVPARVPIELRVRHDGFAEQVVNLPGTASPIARDIALAVGGVSDALIVTAARTAESRESVTESVSSFTRRDIETLGSSSLADIVRYTPGVNLESAGREGSLTSMFTRGGESDYNLVLVDGVRVNQSGGAFDFSRISAADIDRVEVVRGAQSALWGSDAMGAVVQVFTRRAGAGDAPQVTGSAEGGSFGVFRGDARVHGGAANAVDYHAGVSRRATNGAFKDLLPEDDEFDQNAVDGGAGVVLGSRATLRGSVRYTKADGRSVGQIVYGARDTGTGYETRDLSSHINLTHVIGSRFSGSGIVQPLSLQEPIGRHGCRPCVRHLCRAHRDAECDLSEWHAAGPPDRCRRVQCHRRRGSDARAGPVHRVASDVGLSRSTASPSSGGPPSATRPTIAWAAVN